MRAPAVPARPAGAAARRAAVLAAAAAVAAACASRPAASPSPGAVPAAPPAAGAPGAADPSPGTAPARAAAFTWTSAPAVRRLEVRTEAEITDDAGAAEGAERVRTVVTLADTVAAGAVPGAARAAGVVESYEVDASARVQGGAVSPPFVPFAYRAFSDARGVRADVAPGAAVDLRCAAPGGPAALGALAAVRETLPRVPAAAAPGARWRDTTVSATCAGPVLLVVQTASRYEAAAGEGGALAVVRRSTSTVRGQGAAGVRPVSVAGAGTAETRYLLDPAAGALLSASGESRTALTITVAGAARRFTQAARTRVAARR